MVNVVRKDERRGRRQRRPTMSSNEYEYYDVTRVGPLCHGLGYLCRDPRGAGAGRRVSPLRSSIKMASSSRHLRSGVITSLLIRHNLIIINCSTALVGLSVIARRGDWTAARRSALAGTNSHNSDLGIVLPANNNRLSRRGRALRAIPVGCRGLSETSHSNFVHGNNGCKVGGMPHHVKRNRLW
ncbi:hypothetical protein J6590_021105 [Homalodisca vitripennis]|nr:hypothetical protein J6590_021105 [Homalodisca vitripennis]